MISRNPRARYAFALAAAALALGTVALARGGSATAGAGAAGLAANAATGAGAATGGPAGPGASRSAAAAEGAVPAWELRLAIHYLPPVTNRSGYDAVLAEPGVMWFFGGSNVGGHSKPEAEQLRNGRPVSVRLPPRPSSWITAVSAPSRRDIWAVTYLGGSVLRWNGRAWAVAPRGSWRVDTRFTGIVAVGPGDVWAFGTTNVGFIGAGTWHFNGKSWTRASGPGGGLYQASAAAPGNVWGIGVGRVGVGVAKIKNLVHLTSSRWRRVKPPALAGFVYSDVLAIGPKNVWVAGSVAGRPKLGHFNGSRWTALTMPGSVAATGLCRDGTGGLWVVANTGTGPSILRHLSAGGTWSTSSVSANPANEIVACALEPGTTTTWGAGKSAAPEGSAAAAYRHG